MDSSRKKLEKETKGFVLVLTLFTVLILATLIVAFLNITAIDLNLVKNHTCSLQAYYIAEAGIADAINQMRLSGPLEDTQWEQFFPVATSNKYNVSVSQNSTLINCTGLASIANFSRALEVQVKVTGSSPPYRVSIKRWKEVIQ